MRSKKEHPFPMIELQAPFFSNLRIRISLKSKLLLNTARMVCCVLNERAGWREY